MKKVRAPAWIVQYLKSDDPRFQKRALQEICDLLELRFPIDLTSDPFVRAAIPPLKSSPDVFVRRWLYKLAGLLDPSWRVWLKGQLAGGETDPENLSWAGGALSAHVPLSEYRLALEAGELEFNGTALELSPRYFEQDGGPLEVSRVNRVMNHDDDLQHRWLSLLHGKDPTAIERRIVIALNRHPDPLVVEYSIWSLYRDPAGRLYDLSIRQDELPELPANVRRWYYRLLAKNRENLGWPNEDILRYAIQEDPDPQAREGLALGLQEYPGLETATLLIRWYEEEQSPLVRGALARHFIEFSRSDGRYLSLARESERRARAAIGDKRRTIGPWQPPERIEMASLSITDERDEQAFVLAVDAVGFSLLYDVDQVRVFRDLIAELSNTAALRSTPRTEVVHLLTGDGFIVAFLGVDNRFEPLRVGIEIQRAMSTLRQYELRYAVHAGAARVLELSDGSRQLISGTINRAARVMSIARPSSLLISDEYYQMFVHGSRNEFPGRRFEKVSGTVKHDEQIDAYEVLPEA